MQHTNSERIKLGSNSADLIMISIAILVPIASWKYAAYWGESHWFSRSGSVMVIIGVVLENRLFIAKQFLYELSQPKNLGEGAVKGMRVAITRFKTWLTHLLLIAGTFIWGYGDLVIFNLRLK